LSDPRIDAAPFHEDPERPLGARSSQSALQRQVKLAFHGFEAITQKVPPTFFRSHTHNGNHPPEQSGGRFLARWHPLANPGSDASRRRPTGLRQRKVAATRDLHRAHHYGARRKFPP